MVGVGLSIEREVLRRRKRGWEGGRVGGRTTDMKDRENLQTVEDENRLG